VLLGAAVLTMSATLTWASASAGSGRVSYNLLEIPIVPVFYALAVLGICVGGLVALTGRAGGLEVAALAAVAVALVTGFFIMFAESIASLVPGGDAFLTARRLTLGAGVGMGAWVALAAAMAVVVAALDSVRARASTAATALRGDGTLSVAAFLALVAALVAIVQLRQESWVGADTAGISLAVSGVAIPVVSPATFIATWVLAGSIALIGFGFLELGALVAAAAGWVVNASAGATLAAAAAVAGTPVRGAHATTATWLTFLFGALIALAAATLLWRGGEEA
jgi:hypothetical protein